MKSYAIIRFWNSFIKNVSKLVRFQIHIKIRFTGYLVNNSYEEYVKLLTTEENITFNAE